MSTESQQAHARKILATEATHATVKAMHASEDGWWTELSSAALLLGALAAVNGKEPPALDETKKGQELRELTNVYSARRSASDLGEMQGFVLAYGKDIGPDRTIIEVLPALMHEGAMAYGEGLSGRDPLGYLQRALDKIVKELESK